MVYDLNVADKLKFFIYIYKLFLIFLSLILFTNCF